MLYLVFKTAERFEMLILGRLESSFRFLRNLVDLKDHIEKFFAKKSESFWKDGLFKLCEICRKVVEQNSTYII